MTSSDNDPGQARPEGLDNPITGGDGQTYTVRQLRDRVSVAAPNVVLMREIPVGSVDALTVMLERVRELGAEMGEFGLVVDLIDSHGGVPADYRKAIPKMLNMLGAKHIGIALYTNPVARAASRFIANRIGLNVTIHKDAKTAIESLQALFDGAPS